MISQLHSLAGHGAALLLTFLIHSTVILALALVVCRLPSLNPARRDALLKLALVAPLVSTFIAVFAPEISLSARVQLPARIEAVREVLEARRILLANGRRRELVQLTQRIRPAPLLQGAHVTTAAVGLWLLAGGALLLRRRRQRERFAREIGSRVPINSFPGGAVLLSRARVLAGTGRLRLSVADRLVSPIALSSREICIPRRVLSELDEPSRLAVIAHEAAHVRRGDPLWAGAMRLLQSLFFFQPLLRVMTREWRDNAELLCDEQAAAESGDPLVLARSLATVAQWGTSPAHALAATGSRASVGSRVERLVTLSSVPPVQSSAVPALLVCAVGVAACVILLPGATLREATPVPVIDRHEVRQTISAALEQPSVGGYTLHM